MRKSTEAYKSPLKAWMTRMSTASGSPAPLRALRRRPSLIDTRRRRCRLALRPARRRVDVPDRYGDDPIRIEDRERVLGHVLAEAGDRVLVALVVVGADVDVSARTGDHHALDLTDDRVLVRPAAAQLVRLLDGRFQDIGRSVGAFRLEVGILVELRVVLLDKRLVDRPAVPGRIAEMVVGVHAGEDALRMVLPDAVWGDPHPQRGAALHLLKHPFLHP